MLSSLYFLELFTMSIYQLPSSPYQSINTSFQLQMGSDRSSSLFVIHRCHTGQTVSLPPFLLFPPSLPLPFSLNWLTAQSLHLSLCSSLANLHTKSHRATSQILLPYQPSHATLLKIVQWVPVAPGIKLKPKSPHL